MGDVTRFEPGHTKLGGRREGTPNRATMEGRDLARLLVTEPEYFERLRARLLAGKLAPAVEVALWAYAFGKPKDSVDLDVSVGRLDELSGEELAVLRVAMLRLRGER